MFSADSIDLRRTAVISHRTTFDLSQVTTTSKKSSTTFQIRWTTSSMTGDLALRNTPIAVAMHLGDLMRARHDVAKEGQSWLRHRSGQAAQSLLV